MRLDSYVKIINDYALLVNRICKTCKLFFESLHKRNPRRKAGIENGDGKLLQEEREYHSVMVISTVALKSPEAKG